MYADVFFAEKPSWSDRSGRRLALNFLPATIIVLGALAVLRLPIAEQSVPVTELIVRILTDEVEQVVESVAIAPVEVPLATEAAPAAPLELVEAPVEVSPTDWYALLPDVVTTAVDSLDSQAKEYSVNPVFDEKRRVAALEFAPSTAPVERPIWENVERDTLGRTVLRSGDCYRVLDDPNVGSREAFLTFGQFITTCTYAPDTPQELPWVSELQNRREGQARYGHPAVE